ncbi:MAG: hypothetical protein QG635_203, partial [Bacteroidota bacterium]|nr:hypothetical protein [Bacteroidota bacterium]
MLKISTKLTLWYLSATAVIIFIIALAMYYIFDVQRREAIDDDLVDYADFLISGLGSQTSELESVYDEIMQVKKKPPIKPRAHRFALASNDSVIYEPSALQNLSSLIEE